MKQQLLHTKKEDVKVPIIYENDTNLPIISLRLVIGSSGSFCVQKAGLGQISAMILEEGTKKKGSEKFSNSLEQRAINFGVSSTSESLSFELSCLKENFSYGVKKMCELLKDINLTTKSLQKVKTLTLGRVLSKKSDFDYIASVGLQKLLYPNTPLENPSLGWEEDIKSIEKKDVKDFLDEHLKVENAFFILGGDVSENEVLMHVNRVLDCLPHGEKNQIKFYPTSKQAKEQIIVKDTQQAYIYFGSPFDAKVGDGENFKAKVAAFILGSSGFGSRLMEEIRVKRGLAYSAYGRVNIGYLCSEFKGYLQTKNENKHSAIAIVKEVVGEFLQNGATEDELLQAKRFLLGSEPLRSEKLSQRLLLAYSEVYAGFEIGQSKKELDNIEKLTLNELNEYIKRHTEMQNLSFCIVTNEDK